MFILNETNLKISKQLKIVELNSLIDNAESSTHS